MTRFEWTYSTIATGGEKWQLVEHRDGYDATLATLVRLPGSMTRIFRYAMSGGTITDHPGPCEARLVLADELGETLPKLTNRSDDAHARALRMRELLQRADDAQRARDENDEQRDYAEERFNERLMREE